MEKNQVVGFKVAWTADVERLFHDATGNEPTYSIEDLRHEVAKGHAQLFAWKFDEELLGYTVLWIDTHGAYSEMVLQAGSAFKSNNRAAKLVVPAIRQLAINQGCYAMRTHLTDGKWAGVFRSLGFYKSETIMRKRL